MNAIGAVDGKRLVLPKPHAGQWRAWDVIRNNQYSVLRCGRRWGKSKLDTIITANAAPRGKVVGFFAPDYKRLAEIFRENAAILAPVTLPFSQDGSIIRIEGGGRVDFWTLEDESAGRSRHYDWVFIDEAAFTKSNMTDVWQRAIEPTLFDTGGKCVITSNTNGIDEDNFFWRVCNLPEYGFVEYHAPTHDNPLLPLRRAAETEDAWLARRAAAFAKLARDKPPLVYQQEHLAEFVSFIGTFFDWQKLLVNGAPVPVPPMVDIVYATIDTAVKDGQQHDSTAVVYWGKSSLGGDRLVVLDWDVIQIEGSLLETWLPTVFQTLDAFEKTMRVRLGSAGVFIEDKQSGSILIQQAMRRGWKAAPIESKLTDLGKDGRALSVSGYVYREQIKITEPALLKTVKLKGAERNHLQTQVSNFRVGDKDAHKRADDLADCFMYGIAIGLGNADGF